MINWNWICDSVNVYPQKEEYNDVVFEISWTLTGTDEDGVTAKSTGRHELYTDIIVDFVPFEDLTQEQVIGWMHAEMGEEVINEIKAKITNRINEQISPSYITKTIDQ